MRARTSTVATASMRPGNSSVSMTSRSTAAATLTGGGPGGGPPWASGLLHAERTATVASASAMGRTARCCLLMVFGGSVGVVNGRLWDADPGSEECCERGPGFVRPCVPSGFDARQAQDLGRHAGRDELRAVGFCLITQWIVLGGEDQRRRESGDTRARRRGCIRVQTIGRIRKVG